MLHEHTCKKDARSEKTTIVSHDVVVMCLHFTKLQIRVAIMELGKEHDPVFQFPGTTNSCTLL